MLITALAAHVGAGVYGLHWIPFILIPLFWIAVIALIVGLVRRRGMRAAWAHGGPWHNAGRSAESTLAERFANGDIDEKEYRARLEVLRANNPYPPKP
jgi:putative membrane protein